MTTSVFDTLSYAKRLKAAGVPEAQAEAQAEALAEAVGGALVTRHHLDEAMALSRRNLDEVVRGLHATIEACRRDLTEAITVCRRDLTESITACNESILRLEARITAGEGRTNLLQWMVGFNIALTVTILFKIFS